MAILKKIKASTLIEILIATVLIVVIFVVASTILNNVFFNTVKNNTNAIENHLKKLEYQQIHGQLQLPYYDIHNGWKINIEKDIEMRNNIIRIEAMQEDSKKLFSKQYFEAL